MPQSLNFNIKGLFTFPNDASLVPQGALLQANNIDLSKPGIATPRRGYSNHSALPTSTDRAHALISYSSTLFAHVGGTSLYGYISNTWTSRGSITKPTNATSIRGLATNKCLYITSNSGLQKLDSTSNNIYQAGIPKGLHMTLATSGSTGTAVAASEYVAYRYILGRKDAQNNTIYGGVSARAVIQNAQVDARDVTVTAYLPTGLTAGEHFIQLYRTAGSSVVPNDEMQLCYEEVLTSGQISAGLITITDIVTDDLLGASLYTSPSQQGITQDNTQPPLASDIALYKGHTFYADVINKHKFITTLIACGGSSGLVVNDTFTIASGVTSEVYTAKSAENFTNKEFLVDVASSSIAVRIDSTIRSLVNCINQKSTLVYAYLLSTGDSDLPGKIVLEARTLGSAAFTVASSRSTCWGPALSNTPGSSQTSTNDEYKNGLMFSKFEQPEAVPTLNVFFVGSSDDRIKRIIALKESLLVFKEKDGIFRLSGQGASSFTIELLDSTARIVAPESAVVVVNQVYVLTEAGICEVSNERTQIISQPIKNKILGLLGSALLTPTKTYSFGVGYETEGKYIFCTVSNEADTASSYQLVYDVFNSAWSEQDLSVRSGFVNPVDNKLYFGSGNDDKIRIERKNFDYTDYVDFIQTCTASAQTGKVITITGIDKMTVGDVLLQGTLEPCYITAIDLGAGTITIDNSQSITTGVADISHFAAIRCELEWSREFSGNPAGFKHYSEALFGFKNQYIGTGVCSFSSDISPSVIDVEISGPDAPNGWGYVAWGDGNWGGNTNPLPVRVGIPYSVARCNALSIKFSNYKAYSDFELNGVSLVFNPMSTRGDR